MKNGFLHCLAGICLVCGLGAGAAFAALPEGATPLTYIQSYNVNNRRPYLDTGWTLQPNRDVFEAVIEIYDGGITTFWCTRDTNNNSSCTLFNYWGSYLRVDYATARSEISRNIKLYPGIPYTITVSNGTTVVSNGARADVPAVSTFTNTPGPLILFASCQYGAEGNITNITNFSSHRLRSFKIWRDGALVRDFVPVRTADNVVTLADAVEGGVLTPLGTGTFGGGGTLDTTIPPLAATVPPQLARGHDARAAGPLGDGRRHGRSPAGRRGLRNELRALRFGRTRTRNHHAAHRVGARARTRPHRRIRRFLRSAARLHASRIRAGRRPFALGDENMYWAAGSPMTADTRYTMKIGRASCRERV